MTNKITTHSPQFISDYKRLMLDTQSVLKEIGHEKAFFNSSIKQIPKKHYISLIRSLDELRNDFSIVEDSLKFCDEDKIFLKNENEALVELLNEHKEKLETKITPPQETIIPQTNHQQQPKFEGHSPPHWLAIGIPTVPRPDHQDYLMKVLHSIVDSLPSNPPHPHVKIYVRQMAVGAHHPIFDHAKDKFTHPDYPKRAYFDFSVEGGVSSDPLGNHMRDKGTANLPGYKVRKQTRDIASLLNHIISDGLPQYFMFAEDDMRLCPHGLLAARYVMEKSEMFHPDWLAVRASYGMNGIFLHGHDLQEFRSYLIEHQGRRPPDHLVVEWFAGETDQSKRYKKGRENIGFKFNILYHEGRVSTLGHGAGGGFPECYEQLIEPTVFEVEAFKPDLCPNEDIWPCTPSNPSDFHPSPVIDWGQFRGTR